MYYKNNNNLGLRRKLGVSIHVCLPKRILNSFKYMISVITYRYHFWVSFFSFLHKMAILNILNTFLSPSHRKVKCVKLLLYYPLEIYYPLYMLSWNLRHLCFQNIYILFRIWRSLLYGIFRSKLARLFNQNVRSNHLIWLILHSHSSLKFIQGLTFTFILCTSSVQNSKVMR